MSWLRDHFYHFVFPALKCAKETPNVQSECVKNYAPLDIIVPDNFPWRNVGYRMGKQKMPSEIRKLAYFCTTNKILFRDREISKNRRSRLNFDALKRTLTAAESLRKRLGCNRLLFAGRDVWLLEIMAKRAGIESVYLPEISRSVIRNFTSLGNINSDDALKIFLKENKITGNELMVDTGFVGSIAHGLKRVLQTDIKFALMSQERKAYDDKNAIYHCQPNLRRTNEDPNVRPNQLFPNRRKARAEALETEYLPKYFKSGLVSNFKVTQFLESSENIALAACLTSDVWRGKKDSPFAEPIFKEIDGKPIKGDDGKEIKILPYPEETLFKMLQEQIAQDIDKEILKSLDFQVKALQKKVDDLKPKPKQGPYLGSNTQYWSPYYYSSSTTDTLTFVDNGTGGGTSNTIGWYKYTI